MAKRSPRALRAARAGFVGRFAERPYWFIRAATPQVLLDEMDRVLSLGAKRRRAIADNLRQMLNQNAHYKLGRWFNVLLKYVIPALLLAVTFLAFATSGITFIKLFGLGLAMACDLRVAAEDAKLAQQMTDALNSIPSNIGEGNRRLGKDRIDHFTVAAGSAGESRADFAGNSL